MLFIDQVPGDPVELGVVLLEPVEAKLVFGIK